MNNNKRMNLINNILKIYNNQFQRIKFILIKNNINEKILKNLNILMKIIFIWIRN